MTPEQIEGWKDVDLSHAYEELEQLSRDPKMKHYYEERLKGITDHISFMKDNYNKGKAEGKAELVQSMYENGIPVIDIARMTNSTEAQVQAWLSQSVGANASGVAEPTAPVAVPDASDASDADVLTEHKSKKKARSAKRK